MTTAGRECSSPTSGPQGGRLGGRNGIPRNLLRAGVAARKRHPDLGMTRERRLDGRRERSLGNTRLGACQAAAVSSGSMSPSTSSSVIVWAQAPRCEKKSQLHSQRPRS